MVLPLQTMINDWRTFNFYFLFLPFQLDHQKDKLSLSVHLFHASLNPHLELLHFMFLKWNSFYLYKGSFQLTWTKCLQRQVQWHFWLNLKLFCKFMSWNLKLFKWKVLGTMHRHKRCVVLIGLDKIGNIKNITI